MTTASSGAKSPLMRGPCLNSDGCDLSKLLSLSPAQTGLDFFPRPTRESMS